MPRKRNLPPEPALFRFRVEGPNANPSMPTPADASMIIERTLSRKLYGPKDRMNTLIGRLGRYVGPYYRGPGGPAVTLQCGTCKMSVIVSCVRTAGQCRGKARCNKFWEARKELLKFACHEERLKLSCGSCNPRAAVVLDDSSDDEEEDSDDDHQAQDYEAEQRPVNVSAPVLPSSSKSNPNRPLPKGQTTLTALTRAFAFNPPVEPAKGKGGGDGIPSAGVRHGIELVRHDTEEREAELLPGDEGFFDQQLGLSPSVEPAEGEDDGDGTPRADEEDGIDLVQDADEHEDDASELGEEMSYQKGLEGKLGGDQSSEGEESEEDG